MACNLPYFELYFYCQDQYIIGPDGPVALNLLAVNQAMEDFNIDKDERIEFSLAVRGIATIIYGEVAQERLEKIKAAQKKR